MSRSIGLNGQTVQKRMSYDVMPCYQLAVNLFTSQFMVYLLLLFLFTLTTANNKNRSLSISKRSSRRGQKNIMLLEHLQQVRRQISIYCLQICSYVNDIGMLS